MRSLPSNVPVIAGHLRWPTGWPASLACLLGIIVKELSLNSSLLYSYVIYWETRNKRSSKNMYVRSDNSKQVLESWNIWMENHATKILLSANLEMSYLVVEKYRPEELRNSYLTYTRRTSPATKAHVTFFLLPGSHHSGARQEGTFFFPAHFMCSYNILVIVFI